ncbi:ROK family protein, partial [Candidatus Sumerlaeota bacterium]|nr:ROK family protein [Candidatus Sumerlaeota bacterium]
PILREFGAECLVFGGGISRSFDLFRPSLQQALANLQQLKRITVARSINRAAIWGAAYRMLRRN